MPWEQRGLVFVPGGEEDWSRTHAQAPSAILLDDRIRVYYGTRDGDNRSRTSFFEVDRSDPTRLIYRHNRPVMGLGEAGTHDEDGVIASQMVAVDGELRMYYGGVSRGAAFLTGCRSGWRAASMAASLSNVFSRGRSSTVPRTSHI